MYLEGDETGQKGNVFFIMIEKNRGIIKYLISAKLY